MKNAFIIFLVLISSASAFSQDKDSADRWNVESDVNFYFLPQEFILLPVIRADKNKLHLEARYNYEDLHTFSGWIGYNFSGGKKIEYAITTMAGVVTGNSNGLAPGVELSFTRKKWELTSETEYLFEMDSKTNNFLYTWTDLSYSVNDWLWIGISAQRTRLYQTKLDIQRGLLVGAGWKTWEATAYLYNIGFDNPFAILTLTKKF